MGKRRIQKNRIKKNQETTPWADLPKDILGLILGKLPSAVDVIRFRAVCKSWHIVDIPKDYKDHRNLPWLCINLDFSKKNLFDFSKKNLKCEMYDPYSRHIFVSSKLVGSRKHTRSYYSDKIMRCLGSKQGWLIAGCHNNFKKWEIFMYNPYSKEYITLPCIRRYRLCVATFSGNPVSQDCRVFLLLNDVNDNDHCIARYGLNGDKEWEIDYLGVGLFLERESDDDDEGFYNGCYGMQYMNEELFCLFENGSMIRYNLADKSWTPLYLDEGRHQHQLAMEWLLWLAQGEGDLLVAVVCEFDLDGGCKFSTFYFDWSDMSWVVSDSQESIAVFIGSCYITAVFVRPFEDDDDLENNKGCKTYLFHEAGPKKEPSGYSFAEMWKRGKHSFSTVFMEPPRIN